MLHAAVGAMIEGDVVEPITILAHDEGVRLDTDKLEVLYQDLGGAEADRVVCRAIEELAQRLSQVEHSFYNGDRSQVMKGVRSVPAIAEQIGMASLARVGRDVLACHERRDEPAFAATLARLIRLGDRSLSAVWELQDMSV